MRLVFILTIFFSLTAFTKDKKVQEVNFDATDIDGVVRKPDGSYLVQKRGIEFVPLYKVKRHFDESIKESVEYLR